MSRPWGLRPRALSALYRVLNPNRGDDRTRNWPRDGLDPPKERWRYASDAARRSPSPTILTWPATSTGDGISCWSATSPRRLTPNFWRLFTLLYGHRGDVVDNDRIQAELYETEQPLAANAV